MYQPQARGNGMPQSMMPPANEAHIQAKEKLTSLIYEYLTITGATKSAEAFKEENPSLANVKPPEKGPSFLLDWWTVFWDLYCAAPERRDGETAPPTAEAKYYHENIICNSFGPPGMNGHFGGPAMGMPGPDGMMIHPGAPGFHGRFAQSRMPPGAVPPAFGMFPGDPRMARMPANSMRMPAGSFPGGPPGQMRPGGPPAIPAMGRYGGYMESPGPGQAFATPGVSGMMPNGAAPSGVMAPMTMSSPGMPPPVPDVAGGAVHAPFIPLGVMPTSSSAMTFPMGDPTVSTSANNGPMASSSSDSQTPTSGAPVMATSLMNGEEMKPSPASTPRGGGVAGGTPAPGSVQSAIAAQPATPSGGPPSHPPLSSGPSLSEFKLQDDSEISKIKEGLLDGFMKEDAGAESFFN